MENNTYEFIEALIRYVNKTYNTNISYHSEDMNYGDRNKIIHWISWVDPTTKNIGFGFEQESFNKDILYNQINRFLKKIGKI